MLKKIYKLKAMLEEAEIPFEFEELVNLINGTPKNEIGYPNRDTQTMRCCVYQNEWSKGGWEDKLEMMGMLVPKDNPEGLTIGNLSAEEAFAIIKQDFEEK